MEPGDLFNFGDEANRHVGISGTASHSLLPDDGLQQYLPTTGNYGGEATQDNLYGTASFPNGLQQLENPPTIGNDWSEPAQHDPDNYYENASFPWFPDSLQQLGDPTVSNYGSELAQYGPDNYYEAASHLLPNGLQQSPIIDSYGNESTQDNHYRAAFPGGLRENTTAGNYGSKPMQHLDTASPNGIVSPLPSHNHQPSTLNGGDDGNQPSGDSEPEPVASPPRQSLTVPVHTNNIAPASGNEVTPNFEHFRIWSANSIGQHERSRTRGSSRFKCLGKLTGRLNHWWHKEYECHKIFKTKRDFERHWNSIHAPDDEKSITNCPRCGSGFDREDNLRDHRRTTHYENIPKRKVRFGAGQPRKGAKPAKGNVKGGQQ